MSGEQENTPRAGGAAALREAAQQLTALYEREAYRVYNLALRIACERGAAARATEQAFVAQAGDPGSLAGSVERTPAYLLASTVQAALRLSPRRPRTEEEGDAEARPLLAAAATLRGPERAALALGSLAQASPAEVAWALDVTPERAAELRERAAAGFHAALGVSAAEAEARIAAWPWADPPAELWEKIYPEAYRKLERALSAAMGGRAGREGEAEATADASRRAEAEAGIADVALLPARLLLAGVERLSGLLRLPGRVPLPSRPTSLRGWLVRGGVLAALIVALGAVTLDTPVSPIGSGEGDGGTAAAQEDGGGGSASSSEDGGEEGDEYDALTPEELDELRRQELEDLSDYAREQQRQAAEEQAAQEQQTYKPPEIKPPKFGGGSGGGGGGGGTGGGGSGGGGSTGGGSGGGSSTPPPPPPDDSDDDGSTGGSGGSGSGGGGNNSGGGGNNGGGGSGGNGGGGGKPTTLDECIRDTETGQYICPDPKRSP